MNVLSRNIAFPKMWKTSVKKDRLSEKSIINLIFSAWGQANSVETALIPCFLMPWLQELPGYRYHQPWYCLWEMELIIHPLMMNLNNLLCFRVEEKCRHMLMFFKETSAHKGEVIMEITFQHQTLQWWPYQNKLTGICWIGTVAGLGSLVELINIPRSRQM